MAGIFGSIASIFGSNTKEAEAQNQFHPSSWQYYQNQNSKNYGGTPEGYKNYTDERERRLALANGQQAATADFGSSNPWYGQANESRANQNEAANLTLARARGQTPSIAQMQADRQMQQATAAQGAQAASARGPAGVALAGQTSANNIANAQANISGQAQVNAANERLQAEQAAAGEFGQMRGADINTAQYGSDLATRQAMFNAQQQQQQQQFNTNTGMGYEQLIARANEQQLNANTDFEKQRLQAFENYQRLGADVGHQNAEAAYRANKDQYSAYGDFGDSVTSGIAMASDMRSKEPAKLPPLRNGGGIVREDPYASTDIESMLSDRQAQTAPVGNRTAVDQAIEQQIARDRGLELSNQYEANKIRSGFAADAARQRAADTGFRTPEQMSAPQTTGSRNGSQILQAMFAPRRAMGGPVMGGQPYLVGEQGPELMVPQSDGTVMSNQQTRNMGSAAPALGGLMSGGMMSDKAAKNEAYDRGYEEARMDAADEASPRARSPLVARVQAQAERPEPFPYDPNLTPDTAHSLPPPRPGKVEALSAAKPTRDVKKFQRTNPEQERLRQEAAAYRIGQQQHYDAARAAAGSAYLPYAPILAAGGLAAGQVAKDDEARAAAMGQIPPTQVPLLSDDRAKMRPDHGAFAEGNRAMAGSPYTYKPEFQPVNEKPGQLHVGFMAQNLEKAPVTATAVEEDPNTGMKTVDRDRMLQAVASGVSDLQRQQDETRMALATGGKRKKKAEQ